MLLFDIVMSRFDVIAPYKGALSRSMPSAQRTGRSPGPSSSVQWMLQAAGIATDGMTGRLRIGGLPRSTASVLRVWLDDDDPAMARTMAALDRRLRRGERTLRNVEDTGSPRLSLGHRRTRPDAQASCAGGVGRPDAGSGRETGSV